MIQAQATGTPYRAAVRWGLLLAGLMTAALRAPELTRYFLQWRALAGSDAAAAGAYRTYFEVEAGITAFVLAMAVVLFFALRPRPKKTE